jgi:6-phosphogluconolactonase
MASLCPFSCLLAVTAALLLAAPARSDTPAEQYWVYVGTYTGKPSKSKGIYRLAFDPATGKLSDRALAGQASSPSYLAIHPSRQYLYAVGESAKFRGEQAGAVNAFAIDPKTGDLKLLNQESSDGAGPCYITVDRQGTHVLVADYGGGCSAVLPIKEGGRLGEATSVARFKGPGSGVNPKRQEAAHAHSINLDKAGRYAFTADLGLDQVVAYEYDAAKGELALTPSGGTKVAPGSGPRHLDFHPDGKHAYVINELANTITAFDYDGRGELKTIQTISTLPEDYKKTSYAADIHVHPSGKFVYGSNRGHNSIAIFTIDPSTGKLTAAGYQGENVKTPRNFGIDPTGNFLVVANQDGNSLVVFRVNLKTGALEPTGITAAVPAPVCVKFLPIRR